jgi:hypothetical protein
MYGLSKKTPALANKTAAAAAPAAAPRRSKALECKRTPSDGAIPSMIDPGKPQNPTMDLARPPEIRPTSNEAARDRDELPHEIRHEIKIKIKD